MIGKNCAFKIAETFTRESLPAGTPFKPLFTCYSCGTYQVKMQHRLNEAAAQCVHLACSNLVWPDRWLIVGPKIATAGVYNVQHQALPNHQFQHIQETAVRLSIS